MRLLYTPIKDYVHTVEAVIAYTGLADRIKPVPTRRASGCMAAARPIAADTKRHRF